MKLSKLYSKSLWKDSFLYAVSFIAAIETICAIANFSITDICNIQKWWEKGLVIVGVFLLFWIIISVVKAFRADHSITLKIKGINVKIEEGDIFESTDWKLIPFNEFFDTTVDDVVIARNSLNGKFIERLQDIDDLKRQINEAEDVPRMKRKIKFVIHLDESLYIKIIYYWHFLILKIIRLNYLITITKFVLGRCGMK